jgi:hypothetical protein
MVRKLVNQTLNEKQYFKNFFHSMYNVYTYVTRLLQKLIEVM